MYESQRDQVAAQSFNIEQTVFAIETIKDTQTTVAAMKTASKQMKVEHAKINISEIEDMQDDMEDMFEDMNEITEVLGRSYGLGDEIDECDLDAELDCLGDELESAVGLDDELSSPSYLSALPSNPTGPVAVGADTTAEAATAPPSSGGVSLI